MNAYEQAKAWGLQGDDKQVVDQLIMTGVTYAPIDRATLVHVMNLRGMLTKVIASQADERWTGTVLNMLESVISNEDPDQIKAFRIWLSHITNPTNVKWDTTLPMYAAACWGLMLIYGDQEKMPTREDFAALAALGGGWRFAALTVEQFTAERETAEKADKQVELLAVAEDWYRAKANRYNIVRQQVEDGTLSDSGKITEALEA